MAKTNERRTDSLNEALKRREAAGQQHVHHEGEPLALDDAERVKVLSPGRLVAKRFFRNKLAIVGIVILAFMFIFAFIFPLFYPYTQTQIFYTYGKMNANYASASERTDFVSYYIGDGISVSNTVRNSMNSYINAMNADGLDEMQVTDALVSSTLVFNSLDSSAQYSDEFKADALLAAGRDGSFEYDGQTYTISDFDGESGSVLDASGQEIASLGTFVVRRYSGQDTLSIDFKEKTQEVINQMEDEGLTKSSFVYPIQETDDASNPVFDENGEPVYVDTEIYVERKTSEYVLSCEQTTYLIDIYAGPSAEHWFGTDGDGMDILARMMYGGRISLMIGFVVVILETLIGVILGGLAGFFGRWVDTIIMRVVDIFYCIPTYPILIIMGALFDALKMDPYVRLVWMMVALGVLGWAGIARLVRGQILSLREQEFMIAEEATGMRASRRIFRHLVPNVMPQLIVNATMSLGSIIITEATLSFLGLGVKHPLATWGNMINSVTGSSESMLKYTYIWVPVGLLICLTVVAFNFVGDGLRDAFDPKMKQ